MAKVSAPSQWLQQGTLPPVCARHGGPSTSMRKRTFYTRTPWWVILIVLASLLVGLIVALAIRKTLHARLPECARCAQEHRQFRTITAALWGATVVLLVLAVSLSSGGLGLLCFLVGVVALIWSFAGRRQVQGFLTTDQAWVDLKGVSDEFAGAINGALQAPPR